MTEVVKIQGLREFQRALRKLDRDLPKALLIALNDAVNVVVEDAKPRVPRRTGRAANSIKARSTQKLARIQGGSSRAPYYKWLEFGGRVGPKKSVYRDRVAGGRYIYPSLYRKRPEFEDALEDSIIRVAGSAGIEVT